MTFWKANDGSWLNVDSIRDLKVSYHGGTDYRITVTRTDGGTVLLASGSFPSEEEAGTAAGKLCRGLVPSDLI